MFVTVVCVLILFELFVAHDLFVAANLPVFTDMRLRLLFCVVRAE